MLLPSLILSKGAAIVMGYDLKFVLVTVGYMLANFGQYGFYLIMMISVMNTVEYNELKHGTRDEGIISSLRPFLTKLASALTVAIAYLTYVIFHILQYTNGISDLEPRPTDSSSPKQQGTRDHRAAAGRAALPEPGPAAGDDGSSPSCCSSSPTFSIRSTTSWTSRNTTASAGSWRPGKEQRHESHLSRPPLCRSRPQLESFSAFSFLAHTRTILRSVPAPQPQSSRRPEKMSLS